MLSDGDIHAPLVDIVGRAAVAKFCPCQSIHCRLSTTALPRERLPSSSGCSAAKPAPASGWRNEFPI